MQTGVDTAQVRVVQRALLAEEVREAEDVGGTPVLRFAVQVQQILAADEALEPADQAAAGGHAAIGQPPAGHRMGIQIERRSTTGSSLATRMSPAPPQLYQPVAVFFDARGEGRQHMVGTTDDQRGCPRADRCVRPSRS